MTPKEKYQYYRRWHPPHVAFMLATPIFPLYVLSVIVGIILGVSLSWPT